MAVRTRAVVASFPISRSGHNAASFPIAQLLLAMFIDPRSCGSRLLDTCRQRQEPFANE